MSQKAPSFPFYPKDWRVDTAALSLEAKGAWIDLLCAMWYSNTKGELSLTWEEYGRQLGCNAEEAQRVIVELIQLGICDCFIDGEKVSRSCHENVTLENPVFCTPCHKIVTLQNRRMYSEAQRRLKSTLRKQKERSKKQCHADSPDDVTSLLSFSLSNTCKKDTSITSCHTSEDTPESIHHPAASFARRFTPDGKKIENEAKLILAYLNEKAEKHFPVTYAGIRIIIDRLAEGKLPEQFWLIIDKKLKDPNFSRNFMRPETLFSKDNFDKYLYESEEFYDSDRLHGKGFTKARIHQTEREQYPVDFKVV